VSLAGTATSKWPLALKLYLQGRRSDGNGAFFPTNLERHRRFYPGLAANIFRDHQSSGMIDGRFHGIEFTLPKNRLPSRSRRYTMPAELWLAYKNPATAG
jgi:hypothetical protein